MTQELEFDNIKIPSNIDPNTLSLIKLLIFFGESSKNDEIDKDVERTIKKLIDRYEKNTIKTS